MRERERDVCVRTARAMKPNDAPPGSPWRRNFPCSCGELGQPSRVRSGYSICNFSLSIHWELLHPRSCPSQGSHTQPLSTKALPLSSQRTPPRTDLVPELPPGRLRLCQACVEVHVLTPSPPRLRSPVNFLHHRLYLNICLQRAQPLTRAVGRVCVMI